MRFTALFLGVIVTILCMSGCAQKLPTPSATEGLLIIPMKATNTSRARTFLHSYEFLNSSDPTASLQIQLGLQDFWISPLLPQGNYIFDTLAVKAINQNEVIHSEQMTKVPLDKPMAFTITAGKITFVPSVLEAKQYMDESELIGFQSRFRQLSDLELKDYIDKLKSFENSGAWGLLNSR